MAGSHECIPASDLCADPIVRARIEALKQLADGLSERVAVLDRQFHVLYANDAAWPAASRPKATARPAKCYESLVAKHDPCDTCPASSVFKSKEAQSLPCSESAERTACGMTQVLPLMSGKGDVESVLVLFRDPTIPVQPETPVPKAGLPVELANASGNSRLGELIGQSPAMQELFQMIRLVADSHATVLIQGESGTGKELVARTIHRLSFRRAKPFVVVDCGSLPQTLVESELYGHVKGAFTGATSAKRGLLEEADGGTLFLDEIADTTPAFQAKLLRVLQEGEIKPVGGTQSMKIDVRVISASNRELSELVAAKVFRQDLYYRLAVLPLYLPPLRERREDIALLAAHFVEVSCRRHRQSARQIPDEVLHALAAAAWPGNVRELQHYIERAVVTTSGPELACADVVAMGSVSESSDLRAVARGAAQKVERVRIIQALRQSSGNRVRAAKMLKISRANLYNKLREYGITSR
ncbi:MAG TPA: sigma-54 dependent transcriptional regulator [Nitrospiraceae bacterium]|nr:sigma-54 dependent transcriptional regulator [Nitrospiraceae bacterium]